MAQPWVEIAMATCLLLAALPAQAQTTLAAPVRQAVLLLDDRAWAADQYARRTFQGYRGPSRAESLRALGHAVAMLQASEAAQRALRTQALPDLADTLAQIDTDLRQALCPELTTAEWTAMASAAGRARLVSHCQTTSDLIEAVRRHGIAGVIRDLAEAFGADCVLARRVAAHRVGGVIQEANATLMARLSDLGNAQDETRAAMAEMRGAVAEVQRAVRALEDVRRAVIRGDPAPAIIRRLGPARGPNADLELTFLEQELTALGQRCPR